MPHKALISICIDMLAICADACAGALSRYYITKLIPAIDEFPIGTLFVNFIGSTIIGLVMYLSLTYGLFTREGRLMLATGFCGSLTTFSTFAYETYNMLQYRMYKLAIANIMLNVGLCILGVLLGKFIASVIK